MNKWPSSSLLGTSSTWVRSLLPRAVILSLDDSSGLVIILERKKTRSRVSRRKGIAIVRILGIACIIVSPAAIGMRLTPMAPVRKAATTMVTLRKSFEVRPPLIRSCSSFSSGINFSRSADTPTIISIPKNNPTAMHTFRLLSAQQYSRRRLCRCGKSMKISDCWRSPRQAIHTGESTAMSYYR